MWAATPRVCNILPYTLYPNHTSGARYGRLAIWKRSVLVSTLSVQKEVPRSAMTTSTGDKPSVPGSATSAEHVTSRVLRSMRFEFK